MNSHPHVFNLPERTLGPNAKLLIISPAVLDVLFSQRQLKPCQSEAGGQLFGKFTNDVVIVTSATVPSSRDVRSRFRFQRARETEQFEIDQEFSKGFHYLGDWHTHPETKPKPSRTDIAGAQRLFRTSRHQLPHFLMVIVGTSEIPSDLYVALVNGRKTTQLR